MVTATMTVTGTVEDINAALDGLQYTPATDYAGSDTLTITSTDTVSMSLDSDPNLLGYYEFNSGSPNADSSPTGTNPGTLQGNATVTNDPSRGEVTESGRRRRLRADFGPVREPNRRDAGGVGQSYGRRYRWSRSHKPW